jgi:uncharacterized protein (TIGR00730 family)
MRLRKQICVFCASSVGADPIHLAAARAMGEAIGRRGWGLVYGGAEVGLMGAVADAALGAGAPVTGVIPRALFTGEIAHRGLTELVEVATMHERKAEMARRADAFVALPGGLGTLDELCEILTWRLLGIHDKPILLVNTANFWRAFLGALDQAVEAGFLRESGRDLARLADDAESACRALEQIWAGG